MKSSYLLVCALLCVTYVASWVIPPNPNTIDTITKVPHLLGEDSCTWGPSFWCSNITNAKSCNAVKHCIKTVWEVKTLPPDNDSICEICTKMVTEARAQLQSNETQEELKEVFEGSCKLIPLKVISSECMKLVDDFVPELVETLASQMNPQMVCSVAGLCNNARIDNMLASKVIKKSTDDDKECEGCHTVMKKIRANFDAASRDQILQGLLRVCGRMSSLSDACTNIILTNFNDIYNHLEANLNPDEVCIMAGACYLQFHKHNVDVEIIPISEVGKVDVNNEKDDLPCELCEQLVKHLRDLLVANTTEMEFQQVLQGLCKQTGKFKQECLSLVDEYYPQIYKFLISELNANQACVMVGICPKDKIDTDFPFSPLLPLDTVDKAVKILGPELSGKASNLARVKLERGESNVKVFSPEVMQLPIERMMQPSLTNVGNTKYCSMCQYALHFIQEEITSPKNEEKIKRAVQHICEKLPSTINSECVKFIDTYGDAFVALLAQEIDPSQICPLLSLCPVQNLQEVEVLIHSKPNDKPNCPLCLLAVSQLEEMIKNHKTEESIKSALSGLCKHLPKNLAPECDDFVRTYTNELIEMLISDFTPQEVCVYLKLCDATPTKVAKPWTHLKGAEEFDNEIHDNTIEGKKITKIEPLGDVRSPQCVICEFVMSQIEKELKDRKNEDEIKHIVHSVCNHLPKAVSTDCNNFVDKYADVVIQLLIQTMEPAEICSMMALCSTQKNKVREEIFECSVCETAVTALDKLLDNPNVDHRMEHVLKKACLALPVHAQEKCQGMIDAYGDSFFKLVSKLEDSRTVCNQVGLCSSQVARPKRQLVGQNKCTWGPAFWCSEEGKRSECSVSEDYCREYFSKQRQ